MTQTTTRSAIWSPMATINRENDNGITAQFSCFSRLGDGRWSGTVILKNGPELAVEELASSWNVTDVSTKKTISGRTLEAALLKVVGR